MSDPISFGAYVIDIIIDDCTATILDYVVRVIAVCLSGKLHKPNT